MSNEWQDLPNMRAVSVAQNSGWEIEALFGDHWMLWDGVRWERFRKYHGRPAQPKTSRKVKLLGWWDETTGQMIEHAEGFPISGCWHRVPSKDKTVWVQE
jgi:hypothetical protein